MHKERLGYLCNPQTSRGRTDELGSRLERPIHFECKLNEPMHIGMRLLHPVATDHSVSISRQQVQRIFRFSLRSRARARSLSGGTGAVATGRDVTYVTETFPISRSRQRTDELGSLPKGHGYCPFQCPVEASCAVIFWRRLGPHRKIRYCCYGTTHSVGLDNTGKTYPFSSEQECCRSPYLPEGGSEAVTHMDNSQMHMEDWRWL